MQSRAFVDRVRVLGTDPKRILYYANSAEELYRSVLRGPVPGSRALPDGFRVIFVGNIGVAQSFETILSAVEILRDHCEIHWLILGDGRQSRWVHEEVVRRDLSQCVHLLGRYPAESMPDWFAQAEVLLVRLRKDPIFALTIPSKIQSYMAVVVRFSPRWKARGPVLWRKLVPGLWSLQKIPRLWPRHCSTCLSCRHRKERQWVSTEDAIFFKSSNKTPCSFVWTPE